MLSLSFKGKLLLAVCTLVIASGLSICILLSHRYNETMRESMRIQATYLSTAIALEAADNVLINDLVALQKLLDQHKASNPYLAYLFVERNGQVLAHTFPRGVPAQLLNWPSVSAGNAGAFRNIVFNDGLHCLAVAWPIFGGNAGTLHLGISNQMVEKRIRRLWVEISLITAFVLAVVLVGTVYTLRKITRPLVHLAKMAQHLDESITGTKALEKHKSDDVLALASAFRGMLERIREHTALLETQAKELEKSHSLTKQFCEIVKETGSVETLHDMTDILTKRLRLIITCPELCLVVVNDTLDTAYVVVRGILRRISDSQQLSSLTSFLASLSTPFTVLDQAQVIQCVVEEPARNTECLAFPIYYNTHVIGCIVGVCRNGCSCSTEQKELVGLILSQVSGMLRRALVYEENVFKSEIEGRGSASFDGIYGKDPKMKFVFRLIQDTAPTEANVLILGESGTGKELVARSIHNRSNRSDKPFIVINCAAYPDTLLESELFGHEKGAFTGALRQRIGRFEEADGGTIFLDEIGDITPQAQVKLLRVIQTQTFERLGGQKTIRINVRVVAATNRDLEQLIQQGRFREDLYYRLNVIPISIPPLRDRRNDIPILAKHFLGIFAAEQDKEVRSISHDAMQRLLEYQWPGNVRELENAIEHAVVVCKGNEIEARDLPSSVSHIVYRSVQRERSATMRDAERMLLEQTLMECAWNKKEAARRLGIGRATIYAKIRRYKIMPPNK